MDSFQHQQKGNRFSIPPVNIPPSHQFFGGNDQETSPMMENFSVGQFFQDELDNGGGADDSNDAKRRRIARVKDFRSPGKGGRLTLIRQACDMCRKKKIKCDGKLPACSHCINYKTECIFTQVEKKRNPPKGYESIGSSSALLLLMPRLEPSTSRV